MADLLSASGASWMTAQTSGFAPGSEVIHKKVDIKGWRKGVGWTQAELAGRVGCDLSTIRRAERGDVGSATYGRITQVLATHVVVRPEDSRACQVLNASAVALAPLLGAKSEWAIGPDRRSSRPASRLRRHMARLANAHFGVSLEKIAGVYGCRRQSVAEQVQAAEAEIVADDDLAERIAELFALIEATVRRAR